MLNLQNGALLRHQSFVNGEWLVHTAAVPVVNPASQLEIAQVPANGAEVAVSAVVAAHNAFQHWRAISAPDRSRLLRRIAQLLVEFQEDLAQILTAEQGKPIAEAKGEIQYAASYFEWYAAEAVRIYGRLVPAPSSAQRILVQHHPVGVVAAITPWNFPCAMLARKMAPALAAGCTFVAKPAMETPLSALALAYLTELAGVPAGVVNLVLGVDAQAIGEVLTQHEQVAKFTFTGSTPTGKALLAQCANGVKRTTLELGGNAPFIVFEDADVDAAIAGLLSVKFRNAGQTCISANRILLQNTIAEVFLAKLRPHLAELNLGNGLDSSTTLGPLIHKKAVEKANTLIEDAQRCGARVERFAQVIPKSPAFMAPHLVTGVTPEMAIFNTEIFAPVIAVTNFDSEADAIRLANNTPYGLAAYVYTQHVPRIWRVSEVLQYGMLGINEVRLSNAAAPFGGVKQSGFGREGGSEGIEDYLNTQYIAWGNCQ